MELFEGISINGGEIGIGMMALLLVWNVLLTMRTSQQSANKLAMALIESHTTASKEAAESNKLLAQSINEHIKASDQARERNRKDFTDHNQALISTLDSSFQRFDASQTDIKSRLSMAIDRVETPLKTILEIEQSNSGVLATVHKLVESASDDLALVKLALERIENQSRPVPETMPAPNSEAPTPTEEKAEVKAPEAGQGSEPPPADEKLVKGSV